MKSRALSAGTVLIGVVLVHHLVTGLTCKDGYFLNENKDCIACPEHCLFCDSYEYCLYCEKGFWGNVCQLSCTNCMAGSSCEKTDGFCKDACTYGYSGILCDITCDNKCISCTRENPQDCSKCGPGRYPSVSCNKICTGCHEKNCDETGVCALRCVNGSWGQRCDRKCPQHCKYDSCDRDNGTCIFGCNDDSLGLHCNVTIFLDNYIEDKNSTPGIPIVVTVAAVTGLVGAIIGIYLKRKKSPDSQRSAEEKMELVGDADQFNAGESRINDELENIRSCLQKENRVIHKTGFKLYDCLSNCIDSLISLADSSVSTEEMKIFSSAKTLQEKVVTLLKNHDSNWETMIPLLVDNFPLPDSQLDETKKEEYLKKVVEVYTRLASEGSDGIYDHSYTKLCLYASATCINIPIYLINVDLQWHYFEPLFTFDEQPKNILRYITMYLSSKNLYYKVESTDRCAPPPKARGLVGMYMKLLEDRETVRITVPEELRKVRESSKTDLCHSVGKEVIKECCNILLKQKVIDKVSFSKITTKADGQVDFCRTIKNSDRAFETFCKVLIKKTDVRFLSPYIKDMNLFVQSCEYLSQFEALNMLDKAIIERNSSVKKFLGDRSLREKELTYKRKELEATVMASASLGLAANTLMLSSLLLAPDRLVSLGLSLGALGAATLGLGVTMKAGTAEVELTKCEKMILKDIEEVQNTMTEKVSKVTSEMENVEKLFFKKSLNKCPESQNKDPEISSTLPAHSVNSLAILDARLVSTVAADSASMLGLLSFLAAASHDKRRRDKTDVRYMLQFTAEVVETKCKIFNNMLRGDFDTSQRMIEPFYE